MKRPENISKKAQLLKGIGASSWFEIECERIGYRIKRYSENGVLECNRLFTTSEEFDINREYEFTYISHCLKCTIIQDNKIITFKTKEYDD